MEGPVWLPRPGTHYPGYLGLLSPQPWAQAPTGVETSLGSVISLLLKDQTVLGVERVTQSQQRLEKGVQKGLTSQFG